VQSLQVTCTLRIFACLDDLKARRHMSAKQEANPTRGDSGVIYFGFLFAYDIYGEEDELFVQHRVKNWGRKIDDGVCTCCYRWKVKPLLRKA
jgi:hypothetical protein